jgi:hypothetical protein
MSTDFEKDDLPGILARALCRAWETYQAVGSGTLSEEVARSSLARHLVALAKDGMTREGPLTAAGLRHLISLGTPPALSKTSLPNEQNWKTSGYANQPFLHFRVTDARARFLLEWRIPLAAQLEYRH